MDSLWQQTAASLRDATASDSPTPGGGSIACVTGSLGLGLVLMALRITARKTPRTELQRLIAAGSALLVRVSAAADEDVAAFALYMAALRLPKGDEAERATRKHKLSQAAREATRVPLAAADTLLEGLAFASEALPIVAHVVSSDVLAGADLLGGAALAVMRSVNINLASVEDAAEAETLREGQRVRAARARELLQRLHAAG
jgi:formiminotetrahydrofolate cyclodeaminase